MSSRTYTIGIFTLFRRADPFLDLGLDVPAPLRYLVESVSRYKSLTRLYIVQHLVQHKYAMLYRSELFSGLRGIVWPLLRFLRQASADKLRREQDQDVQHQT